MLKLTENKFETRDELIEKLHSDIFYELSLSIEERGVASMLLSGGTTPGELYKQMSSSPLSWSKVWFGATDERWVEPDHDDSNEKLIRDTLIQNRAKSAHYIGLKTDGDDPKVGLKASNEKVSNIPVPYDIVMLGMGDDGHTASLFPDSEDVLRGLDEENGKLCTPIFRGENETPRMTMTLNALLNSKRIYLYFYGEKKLEVFEEAKLAKTRTLPVSYLLHQNKIPVHLYWAQ